MDRGSRRSLDMVEAEASKGGTIGPVKQVRQLGAAISVFVERRFGERGEESLPVPCPTWMSLSSRLDDQVGRQCVKVGQNGRDRA
jgi:hypothetical protein